MKKLLKLTLACMLGITLAGCGGGSSEDSEKTVLTFWGHQNEAWSASYKKAAKAFEKENKDIKINFEFFPYDQFESKVQTSLISKKGGADIYELWGGWAIDFASTGSLAEMPEDFTKDIRENAYPSTYGALEHDGKLFGVPLEFNIENGAMLVNNTIMKEAGLSVPTTWSELRETAKAATVMDGDSMKVKGLDFVNWDGVPYLFLSMILSQGGTYQNEDGTFNLQTPEAKNALNELYEMITKDKVTNMEGLDGGGELEGYQQLYAGRIAMVPRGPWTISEGEHSFGLKYGKDFDYVSMPWFGEKAAFANETGWSLAVNQNSKKQEAAIKFLEYMFQDDVLLQVNTECTQISSKKAVNENPKFLKKMPYAEPLIGILDSSQFIGYFNTDQFKENVNGNFSELVAGKTGSVDEALVKMEADLNGILK